MPKRTNGSRESRSLTTSAEPAWRTSEDLHVRGPGDPEGGTGGSAGQGRRVRVAVTRMDERPSRARGQAHQAGRRGRRRGERARAGPRHGRPAALESGDRGVPGPRGGTEVTGRVPRVGVVTFPGSLDDRDALRAIEQMGGEAVPLWHADRDLGAVDAVVLPGGFSYGDYLRCGAIARFAAVMEPVVAFAARGGPVLGICNGFQVLCEAGLLPGAMIRNRSLAFVCRWIHIRPEPTTLDDLAMGSFEPLAPEVLSIPIKHGEGQYVASAEGLAMLETLGQVAFRYCSPAGAVDPR